jgi:hypothetical protein
MPVSPATFVVFDHVFPGQADNVDFFGRRLARGRCLKAGGDEDTAGSPGTRRR